MNEPMPRELKVKIFDALVLILINTPATATSVAQAQDIVNNALNTAYNNIRYIGRKIKVSMSRNNDVLSIDNIEWEVVEAPEVSLPTLPISQSNLVFTGTLKSMTRDEARKKAIALGAAIFETVTKNIDYLVVGHDPGAKLTKAKSLGVKTLTESEFLAMLSNKANLP